MGDAELDLGTHVNEHGVRIPCDRVSQRLPGQSADGRTGSGTFLTCALSRSMPAFRGALGVRRQKLT
jgi:hypothetical protein